MSARSGFSTQTPSVLAALCAQPSQWRHGYALAKQTGLKPGTLYRVTAGGPAAAQAAAAEPAARPGARVAQAGAQAGAQAARAGAQAARAGAQAARAGARAARAVRAVRGVRLIAREALMRDRIGNAMLFAAAAALAAWAAWPGAPGSFATSVDRVDVITIVLLLAGLPLLARRLFGPPADRRVARFLRVGTYVAILALIPAKNVVEQVLDAPPRGGIGLHLYRLISGPGFGNQWANEILFLVVMALYAAAILRMTSRRSRVAPATLATGAVAGTALGAVMYAVVPLGLSGAATNPWLPGSDIDPLVVLAWILLFGAPLAAAVVAERRFTASSSLPPPAPGPARSSRRGSLPAWWARCSSPFSARARSQRC